MKSMFILQKMKLEAGSSHQLPLSNAINFDYLRSPNNIYSNNTPSTIPPNLTRLSLHISQVVNGLTGYRYVNAEGVSENIALGLNSDQTGNYHRYIPRNFKNCLGKRRGQSNLQRTRACYWHLFIRVLTFKRLQYSRNEGKVAGETLLFLEDRRTCC